MKKIHLVYLFVVFFTAFSQRAVADETVRISVNGREVTFGEQVPVIENGRTLVPVREVFEKMGFEVGWESEMRRVSMSRPGDLITFTIDNERTMIPIREVAESVGFEVEWDDGAIAINTPRRSDGEYKMLDFTSQSGTGNYDISLRSQIDEGSNWWIQITQPEDEGIFRVGVATIIHSGSLQARVDGVRANGDIYITWIRPERLTHDMAFWFATIDICASVVPEQFNILENSRW
ncbi:MAG: copper amine oxidase N-terminal domain-containing protein [Defluviitaleaceae bacterium]|nr:copper amine oxidase N-terminal domain-containing protein [Defluviitaleaceae bacterium]